MKSFFFAFAGLTIVFVAGCAKQKEQEFVATIEQEGSPTQTIRVKGSGASGSSAPNPMLQEVPQGARFTQAQVSQISDGMTLQQVETIMGEPGIMTANMSMDMPVAPAPGSTTMTTKPLIITQYTWKNSEQSFVKVDFMDGLSKGKVAINLR